MLHNDGHSHLVIEIIKTIVVIWLKRNLIVHNSLSTDPLLSIREIKDAVAFARLVFESDSMTNVSSFCNAVHQNVDNISSIGCVIAMKKYKLHSRKICQAWVVFQGEPLISFKWKNI